MPNQLKQRRSYLDVIRILASFLVCFNHSEGYHIYLDQQADGSLLSWLMVLIPAASRINLPMFIMITGALTLHREESYRNIGKKIGRFAVIILAASLVKYSVDHPANFSLNEFIYGIFSCNINMSYWYLYAYIAYLLTQPFLHRIAVGMTGKDFVLLVMLRMLLLSILPLVNYALNCMGRESIILLSQFQLPLSVLNIFFYPLIGYYLANVLVVEQMGKKQRWGWFLVYLFCVAAATVVTYHEGMRGTFTQSFITLFDYLCAIAIFIVLRSLLEKARFPEKLQKLLAAWSGFTFGIYVMEPLLATFFYIPFVDFAYQFHPIIRMGLSGVWCLFIIAAGSLLTWLLRKVPGCKKLL